MDRSNSPVVSGRTALAIGRSRENGRTGTPPPAPASPKEGSRIIQPAPVPGTAPLARSLSEDRMVPPPGSSTPAKQPVGPIVPPAVAAMRETGSQIKRSSSSRDSSGTSSPIPVGGARSGSPAVASPLGSATSVAQSPPVAMARRVTSGKNLEFARSESGSQSPPAAAGVRRDKSPRPSVLNVFPEGAPPAPTTPPLPAAPPPSLPSLPPPPPPVGSQAAVNAYALPPPPSSGTHAAAPAPAPASADLSVIQRQVAATQTSPRLRRSPSTDEIDIRQSQRAAGLRRSPSTESFFSATGTLRLRSQAISVIEKEKQRVEAEPSAAAGRTSTRDRASAREQAPEPAEVDIRRSIAKTRAERTLRKATRAPMPIQLEELLSRKSGRAMAPPPVAEVFGSALSKPGNIPRPPSGSSVSSSPSSTSTSPSPVSSTLSTPTASPSSSAPAFAAAAPSFASPAGARPARPSDALVLGKRPSAAPPPLPTAHPMASASVLSMASPSAKSEKPERRATYLFPTGPVVAAPRLQELFALEGEELTKAARRFADRTDLAARNEQGLTPLHEACESHAAHVVLELIRFKAPVTIRAAGGNTPLHLLFRSTKWQEFKDHKALTHLYSNILSAAAKYVPQKTDLLEAENDRGETLLFRAASAGNFTAVLVILQHGANPFAAFYPEDAVPTHDDSVRALQVAISDAKDKLVAAVAVESKKAKKHKATAQLRPAPVPGYKRPDLRSGPPSSWQYMTIRMQDDPLASDTLELVNKLFSAAYAHRESWSMMQNVQLTEDHSSQLKEERGRYFVGFPASHEVLQCLRDSFTLWNSSDVPIRYEIAKYFPDLSTWGAAMLRLEIIGQRRGVLQPGERQRLQVNLFSTTAVEFRQLICVTHTPDTREGASARPAGLYFFLAASLRPPADLKTLEIERSLLPTLSDVLGVGGSASVFRVNNFIPERIQARYLAVKRFNYSIEGGLQETSEDYRRFRLELYISSKMMHPNVVRTFGFVAHPPCLVMEYVPMNLRRLIDDKSRPLALHVQMKIAIHIAKGMAYLHSFNIIHRDLKPGNVLVSDGYDAKVADFGVSLAAKGGGASGSGKNKLQIIEAEGTKVEGTDFYMAPELFAVTTSQLLFSLDSDVYAFGIVLYELLNRCNLLEDLLRTGFNRAQYYQRRARGSSPVEGAIQAPHPALADLLRACWAAVPANRVAFQAIVDIITELRAEVLELSLEEEFEEARKEGLEEQVLKEWNVRRVGPNMDDAERFTAELRGNRQVAAALVRYYLTAQPSPAAEAEITSIIELYLGHKGAAEFLLNLAAIRPALAELRPNGVETFLTQTLGTTLATPPAMRDQIYRTGLAEDEVMAWFEFVDQAARDPALRQRLGPGRYESELSELDVRMQELREELKRCEKRKAKLETAPPATLYLSELAGLGLDALPPELPTALLERLERDVERLADVAPRLPKEQLAASVRRLDGRLGAVERLCPRGEPLVVELRSKLQELLIMSYV